MARRVFFLKVAVAVLLAGGAAATTTPPAAAIPAGPAAPGATASFSSFLECLQHAPEEGYSVVRSLAPRYLTSGAAQAWGNPDLAMTVFIPSDAAFAKFWKLSLADVASLPVERFRSAFTPFVKYSVVPRPLAPSDIKVGATEPTWFAKQKPGAELRFVAGEAGARAAGAGAEGAGEAAGGALAVRAKHSLAPLTADHWRCGKGWAHGVDSLLLF